MATTELATRGESTDLVDRMVAGKLSIAEEVALRRVVKLAKGQEMPSREEFVLMLREADHLDLDVFAGQCYFVDFGDGWACYPHWSGLVKIAEATGEYEGMDAPLYSADGKQWTEAWAAVTPPAFAKVSVYRRAHRPTTAIVRWARVARPGTNGRRSQWDKDPEGMLGKSAFRLALRRAFPREADRPLSPEQLKALHSIAAHRGVGGDEKRPERLLATSEIVGRPVESFTDLSAAEASEVLDVWVEEEAEVVEEVAGSGDGTRDAGHSDVLAEWGTSSPPSPASTVEPGGEPWDPAEEAAGGVGVGLGEVDDAAPLAAQTPLGALQEVMEQAKSAGRGAMAKALQLGCLASYRAARVEDLSPEACEELTAKLISKCL